MSDYDKRLLYSLATAINNIKNSVVKEGYKLPPEAMSIIKEMRDNLNDIIVEDMM